jgi:hypothetical protein
MVALTAREEVRKLRRFNMLGAFLEIGVNESRHGTPEGEKRKAIALWVKKR